MSAAPYRKLSPLKVKLANSCLSTRALVHTVCSILLAIVLWPDIADGVLFRGRRAQEPLDMGIEVGNLPAVLLDFTRQVLVHGQRP